MAKRAKNQLKHKLYLRICEEPNGYGYVEAFLRVGVGYTQRNYVLEMMEQSTDELTSDELDEFIHIHNENARELGAEFVVEEDVKELLADLEEKEAQGG